MEHWWYYNGEAHVEKSAVLTGGSDCTDLNPALKWIVNTALDPAEEASRGTRYSKGKF